MQIIEGVALSKLCDYSFGDHAVLWNEHLTGNVAFANAMNTEFLAKAKEFEGRVMTLFIDNIRLYPREVKTDTENDKKFVDYLMKTNNLLALCSLLPNNGFVIYTGQEDTPIDKYISLPFNVEKIYAVNALYNTDNIIPFPFGVQRKIGANDHRLEILQKNVEENKYVRPEKLLYINCGIERNKERERLAKFVTGKWATVRFDKDSKFFPYDKYQDFLDEIRNHKFMVCPQGHGADCHRNWEALYMRRVPVMKRHPYFTRLMEGFPVLFIDEWDEITRELLIQHDYLFEEALNLDLNKLDLLTIFKK